jgi:hypothetical protein
MHTKFWTLLQSPIRVQTKTVILHQLEISNMIFTCYLWYIMHQHILYSRFQSDRRARAATACSLHCQFDYPSFPKEKKFKFQLIIRNNVDCSFNTLWTCLTMRRKTYSSKPRYSISPPSSCTAGRIRVSNSSLIIVTVSESSCIGKH